MNADQFYKLFKEALDRLDVDWRGMGQVEVKGEISLTVNDGPKEITVKIKAGDDKKEGFEVNGI